MIGVLVDPAFRIVATEFFELCKTSWEFAEAGRNYEVIIATSPPPAGFSARVVLHFSPAAPAFAVAEPARTRSLPAETVLLCAGRKFPIYGGTLTFPGGDSPLLTEETSGEPVVFSALLGDTLLIRVGYDLFSEVRLLLTKGQPAANAALPTLELHLAVLRNLITRAGIPFVEIPPVPDGYTFIACLSHDVDHPVLRRHRWDRTLLGFVYRASVGTAVDVCRGRKTWRMLGQNLRALGRLPFVHLGWAEDFWQASFDRYLAMEQGVHSTFFLIPRKGHAGRRPPGLAPAFRASSYEVAELAGELQRVRAAGSEVGLHGLDAWIDAASARAENEELCRTVGPNEKGVRMHWLYFNEQSPAVLDEAGFSYDSSMGYNQTVGYRAGTTQAYRPLNATTLLELPLHLMDTSLFYPSYLDLADHEALAIVRRMMNDFAAFGGALTINWHDRSIAPERLWGEVYSEILRELAARRAWCPTASSAVSWFRRRRAASVAYRLGDDASIEVTGRDPGAADLPGLLVRVHRPCRQSSPDRLADGPAAEFLDFKLQDNEVIHVSANS